MTSTLLYFPTEILIDIILNLDFQSALSFQRVNRLLHKIYQDSAQLQYHVECGIAGVRDNPNCSLPVTTRLQMLRDREKAWGSCRPSVHREKLSFPTSDIDILDVAGGHCYIGLRTNTEAPSWIGSRRISTLSEDTAPGSYNWSHILVPGLFEVETCIDEHDLLVCFVAKNTVPRSEDYDFQISLIQHSSGNPHPAAAKPTFSIFQAPSQTTNVALQIEVVGENLVLAFTTPFKRLYFYKWQTGEKKAVHPYHGGITFLRHDILCHLDTRTMSLEIYYIPSSCEVGPVRCIEVLLLPEDLVQGESDWVNVRSSPRPTSDGVFPKYVPSIQPFLERPEEAIILFQFFTYDGADVCMIVHRKSLLELLPSREHWWGIQFVHWDDWSSEVMLFKPPHNLRFIPTGQHGQRCIANIPLEGVDLSLHLFDFNPYRSKRAQPIDPHRSHTPVLHKAGILPYTVTMLPQECVYNALFMSDVGFLGIEFEDKENFNFQFRDLGVVYFV